MCGIFMDREQLAERFAEAASMPRDVVMGASVITITGRNEICIENYRGILEYTDLLIRVQTKSGQIRLSGKNLQIEYYTNDEMKITGRIVQLEFTDGRKGFKKRIVYLVGINYCDTKPCRTAVHI